MECNRNVPTAVRSELRGMLSRAMFLGVHYWTDRLCPSCQGSAAKWQGHKSQNVQIQVAKGHVVKGRAVKGQLF